MTEPAQSPAPRPATPPPPPAPRRRGAQRLTVLLPLAAAAVALWALRAMLRSTSYAEITERASTMSPAALASAVLITAAVLVLLALQDWTTLRSLGHRLALTRTAPISGLVYAIAHAAETALVTSAPLRYRLYAALGLGGTAVVRLLSTSRTASWLTLLALAGALLASTAPRLSGSDPETTLALRAGAAALLLLAVAAAARARGVLAPTSLRVLRLELPSLRAAPPQLLLAALSWLGTGAVLHVLLEEASPGLPPVLAALLTAQVLGLVSGVPGGLGVFEATVAALLAPLAPMGAIVAALLLYRLVYTGLPLAVALATTIVLQRKAIRHAAAALEEQAAPWLGPVVPRGMAIATFVAGAFLIVSGSIPAEAGRLRWLGAILPLGLVEASHLVSSVSGLALLVLARGLARRLDGAWHASVWILAVALVTSLLAGLDVEEAAVAAIVLLLLIVSRRHFYRRASLTSRPFSNRWLLGVGVVLLGSLWLGVIASGNAQLSEDQLWRFSLRGDVPRFLRAQVALATGVLVIGLLRMLRGATPPPDAPEDYEWQRVLEIVAEPPTITSNFALLGDKRFLWSERRDAFVMYGVSGDSWVALGDPVVPSRDPETVEELIWRFREEADLYDERSVFYQIRPDNLALYLEAGLSVIKIGESARTSLQGFSLAGGARRDLRQSLKRGEREGLTFEIAPREATPELLPQLREISDEWLSDKNASEKAFSLGAFSEAFLVHFPIALVRRDGEIVAFANVVRAGREELSVDLMRYRGSAPPGVMDFLFCNLMLWGSSEGFAWFHLGMAPLAGLEQHALAPTWNRLGAWLFRHGEHFYNFRGLRAYKEKFSPQWEPRYIAAPDGLATSRALLDVATLISGGLRGLLMR